MARVGIPRSAGRNWKPSSSGMKKGRRMKWLGLIVAIVLTEASILPHAWAQPPPLTYAQPLSQAGVMTVQQRLKQNGAYAGQTDGVWGPDSAAALEQFQ